MTEKRRPTYDLEAIKAAFSTVEGLSATGSAIRGAAGLGFGRAEIVETIQTLQRKHFRKSMTSHANHRIWQDVYHAPSREGAIYVKFTSGVVTEFLLLSFKAKDDG